MTIPSSPSYRLCRRPGLLRRFFSHAASNTSGAVAVEFGFMVPVFALMVIAVVDIGMGVYRKMQVEDAAQAGVQYAIAHGFDANAISAAVTSATNSSDIAASPSPVTFCGCARGSSISTVSCGTTCPGGALAATYTTVSAQATYSTILDYQVVPQGYIFSKQSTARLQ
jgi:Flp pilus assembly protein TadG